jgi:hypothetical protein
MGAPHVLAMFEHRSEPVIPTAAFRRRVARHVSYALVLLAGSLALGIAGFRAFCDQSWMDALLNASMLLSGMGPVGRFDTDAAKLFASAYALYAGVVFVAFSAVLVAPFVHRLLHKVHVEQRGR